MQYNIIMYNNVRLNFILILLDFAALEIELLELLEDEGLK
jgi:hypothetical protein